MPMSVQVERQAGTAQGLALLLPVTLTVMGVMILAPVVPQLLSAFHAVPGVAFWVPVLLTIPGLCIALFSTLAGYLGDRLGRRQMLVGAMLIYSIAGMTPILLGDLYAIVATRIVVGLCEAFVLTLSTAMIGDLFAGHEREKWLAGQTAVASISALLFLVLGGLLGQAFGWRGPFAVYGVTLLFLALVVRLTWEAPRRHRTRPSGSAPGFPLAAMLGICAVTIVASVMFYTMQIQMSSALAALGIGNPAQAGVLTALASIGVPLGTFVFWRLAGFSVAALLAIEFGLLGTTFVGMSHVTSVAGFVALSFVNQVGAGMVLPTLLTWAIRQLPTEVRGRGTGMWQSVFALGQFVGGLTVPAIALHAGGLLAALQYLGAAALCAAVLAGAALARSGSGAARRQIGSI